MTRYELYVKTWKNCTNCHYHERRKKVVLGSAEELPCDVLFIGESPGESEDVHGVPFFGQAGFVMEDIRRQAIPAHVHVAYNNLTGCYPLGDDGEKEDPDDDCVKICSPRLKEFIALASPRLIITVGKLSHEWLDRSLKVHIPMPQGIPIVGIVHPAAILRQPFIQRELSVRQCVITVRKAVQKHILDIPIVEEVQDART